MPVAVYLWMLVFLAALVVTQWRRKVLRDRRAALPTELRSLVGDAPGYHPPQGDCPDALAEYAAFHKRSRWPGLVLWGLSSAILLYAIAESFGSTAG